VTEFYTRVTIHEEALKGCDENIMQPSVVITKQDKKKYG
jgi:hypothetical protein